MVTVEQIALQLLNGFVQGSIYVLLAMGLTIIFGLMGVVNLSHGAFYALGAYVGLSVIGLSGPNGLLVAIVVVPLVLGVVGAAVESTLIRPLYDRNLLSSLLLTFGLMLVLHESIKILWGTGGQTFARPPVLATSVSLGFVTYPSYRLFVVGMTALTALGVWVFLNYTDVGIIIRGATENRDMVKALGIDIGWIYTLVFALGIAIAGIGGVLHAPLVSVYPEMGVPIIIQSFVVVVIGGLNSFRGSIVAGIIVGEASTLTYLVWPAAVDVVVFLVMAVFLVLRPEGLLGRELGGLE